MDSGRSLRRISPNNAVVWYDFGSSGCAAKSCCPKIVFFCCDAHLDLYVRWGSAEFGEDGRRLLPAEALELGRALFAPLLLEAVPT